MTPLRSWRGRIAIGVLLGIAAALVWLRREASIATTPAAPSESGITNDESRWALPPAVISSEAEKSRPVVPRDIGTRSLDPARDDADRQFVIRHSSFVIPNVPFVSQAPFRIWDLPYKEFCEEASVFTIHLWKQGKRTPPADELDRSLKDIQEWETANLRTWEDTTAEETARVLREKFGHVSTKVVRNVTIKQIKAELDAGRPVIVPAAGRELSSPYYRPPGPLYHMLVIIGYDDAAREFITNDVGTNTKGAGFRFTYDDLYGAIGDWDIARGAPDTLQKVMIVLE
ncbi:C39 family peptidase [Candidatus Uhrbacteria bacterium]|nr:C39 family peptidase [Candidatus Uhrbacteria bacterium]